MHSPNNSLLKHKITAALTCGLLTLTIYVGIARGQEGSPGQELPPPMPVFIAKDDLPLDISYKLRQEYDASTVFMTHDGSLYYHGHYEEFLPHNVVSRAGQVSELAYKLDARVGKVRAKTSLGVLTLDELITDPRSRIQGFIVVHQGNIIYEQYPGMQETDNHIWMSSSKTVTGLLVGLLEAEGKIDVSRPADIYLPELKGTNWEGISVIDIMDMASGLDLTENMENMESRTHPFGIWGWIVTGDREGYGSMTSVEALWP